ncbi:hypothetical protein V8F20_001389 [Naviculisporaceae sp. PSN 640]
MNNFRPQYVTEARRREAESAVILDDGREPEIIDLTEDNEDLDATFNVRANTPPEYSAPASPNFANWSAHRDSTGASNMYQQPGYHSQAPSHEHLTVGTHPTSHGVDPRMGARNPPGPMNTYRPVQNRGQARFTDVRPNMIPGQAIAFSNIPPRDNSQNFYLGSQEHWTAPDHLIAPAPAPAPSPTQGPTRRGGRARQSNLAPVAPMHEEDFATMTPGSWPSPSAHGSGQASGGTRPKARVRRGGRAQSGAASATPAQASAPSPADNPLDATAAEPLPPDLALAPVFRGARGSRGRGRGRARASAARVNSEPASTAPGDMMVEVTSAPPARRTRKRRAQNDAAEDHPEQARAPVRRRVQRRRAEVAPGPSVPEPAPGPARASGTGSQRSRVTTPSENLFDDISDRDFAALDQLLENRIEPVSAAPPANVEAHSPPRSDPVELSEMELEMLDLAPTDVPIDLPSCPMYESMKGMKFNVPKRGGRLVIKKEQEEAKARRRRRNGEQ